MKSLVALFFLAFSPAFAVAATQPVILFANLSCPDAQPHIGSTIRFYSAMVQSSAQVSASVTASVAGPLGSVTLNSDTFATLPSQTLYVTEGKRAWQVPFTTGNPIVLTNGNLVGGSGTPLAVEDYATLVLRSFRVYQGTLVTGVPTLAATKMWMSLGMISTTELTDNGLGADLGGGNDGLWQGTYTVTDLDRLFENVQIFASGRNLNVNASQVAGENVINIDAQLPKITQVSFSTNRVNYSGVLYLSAGIQGTSNSHPTNALGTFTVISNKNSTNVTVTIDTPGSAKVLPPIFVAPEAGNRSGMQTWIGDNGAGVYVPDGVYAVHYGISDIHGVQGVTVTSLVRVVSLRVRIENIVLTPSMLPTDPYFEDGLITRAQYRVIVDRDNGLDMAPSLRVLGWNLAGVEPNLNELLDTVPYPRWARRLNTVFALSELEFLNPDGTQGIEGANRDRYPQWDRDVDLLWLFRGSPDTGFMANCYTPDNIGTTTDPAVVAWVADGDPANDWDSIDPFERVGSVLAPTRLQKDLDLIFRGNTPPEGNYRLRLRAFISGLDALNVGGPSEAADTRDFCLPASAPPVFRSTKVHFAPSARPEGDTSGQGFGIYAEDTTATLIVSRTLPPTGDTSPPFLIDSNPNEGAEVRGSDFGILAPLSVVLRDNESPISSDNDITRIILKDPDGNQILGSSRTDGGAPNNQMTVYFYPLQALSASGTYTMLISACSAICMPPTEVKFSVLDERTPSVLSVELRTLSGGLQPLALNNGSFQGPFSYVSEISVRLGMGSGTTNTVDWQNSNLKLFEFIGGVPVEYADIERVSPLTSTAQAPADSRLTYRLGTPINRAGQFEIRIRAASKSTSGAGFVGPGSGFTHPRLATQLSTDVLGINHQSTLLSALVAPLPVTITVSSTYVTPNAATISIVSPPYSSMNSNSGFEPLGVAGSGWHMMAAGIGLVSNRIRFLYNAALPPSIILHYDDADVPNGIPEASLAVYGYDGGWQAINTGIVASQAGATGNTFTITPPNGTDTYYAYAVFYPDANDVIGAPTPTAIAFKDTRSFNPTHRDPLHRRARIYYSDAAVSSVEARVFDTSGNLLRTLSVGNGIQLSDRRIDGSYGRSSYYFEWDGRNDSGVLARNGLYLIRWKVVGMDGVTEHRTRPVALIK